MPDGSVTLIATPSVAHRFAPVVAWFWHDVVDWLSEGRDAHEGVSPGECASWARKGECASNLPWMVLHCAASCAEHLPHCRGGVCLYDLTVEPAGSRRTVSVKGFSAVGSDAAARRAVEMGGTLALTYELTFPAIAADRRLLVAVNHTKQDSEAWAGHPTLYYQSGSLVHSYIVCDFYLSEIALGISFLTGWLSLIALRRQLCQMFPEWAEVAPTWVAHALLFAGLVLPVFLGWVRGMMTLLRLTSPSTVFGWQLFIRLDWLQLASYLAVRGRMRRAHMLLPPAEDYVNGAVQRLLGWLLDASNVVDWLAVAIFELPRSLLALSIRPSVVLVRWLDRRLRISSGEIAIGESLGHLAATHGGYALWTPVLAAYPVLELGLAVFRSPSQWLALALTPARVLTALPLVVLLMPEEVDGALRLCIAALRLVASACCAAGVRIVQAVWRWAAGAVLQEEVEHRANTRRVAVGSRVVWISHDPDIPVGQIGKVLSRAAGHAGEFCVQFPNGTWRFAESSLRVAPESASEQRQRLRAAQGPGAGDVGGIAARQRRRRGWTASQLEEEKQRRQQEQSRVAQAAESGGTQGVQGAEAEEASGATVAARVAGSVMEWEWFAIAITVNFLVVTGGRVGLPLSLAPRVLLAPSGWTADGIVDVAINLTLAQATASLTSYIAGLDNSTLAEALSNQVSNHAWSRAVQRWCADRVADGALAARLAEYFSGDAFGVEAALDSVWTRVLAPLKGLASRGSRGWSWCKACVSHLMHNLAAGGTGRRQQGPSAHEGAQDGLHSADTQTTPGLARQALRRGSTYASDDGASPGAGGGGEPSAPADGEPQSAQQPAVAVSLANAAFDTGRPAAPESTLGGDTTCIVCFTNPKTHIAAPCGHLSACGACSAKMEQCPYCREPRRRAAKRACD
ncbi:hypothetical protein EMIHUDRAFT_452666 [Emiliania huxleyi CCMP1516]|uniref:RING-type domain-containing protein n=2 Tax=Emiliania huxleyi TaxID=2903 RepID=A0A0D3IGP3_EMIH1|nr:hypothetical protein EMIHUDRAFT_452666 [Emiliania huxleyi CCMP1516]EOD10428.1 hypothetical protein EMIHUDRAFT_452666 [Emiliania huxleyi CCMP1516]|eukprot:XP_005762857.1 hypothetical protein EMIHUDRAFT_452666 [Emiliania huxleyi CCMP1516]